MSRSAFSLITARLSCAISSCSGFICPCPGKDCCGSASRPPYREIQKQIGMILRKQYAPPKELPHQLLALVIEADNVVVVEPLGIGGCSMQTANFAGRAAECERMAQSTRDPENKAIWERM